jgi:putative phage-type endonuclease
MDQGSPEWFAARLGRVTASRVADIVARTKTGYSASRAGYMAELICERLTGRPAADVYVNADMQRGTDLEPIARAMYEIATGRTVHQVGFVVHPTLEMAGASPDGYVDDDGLLEVKCPRPHIHLDYLESQKPPAKYLPQMAWQCICTQRTWADFASYCDAMPEDLQLFIVRYEPPLEYLKELEAEVTKFLEETEQRLNKVQQLRKVAA